MARLSNATWEVAKQKYVTNPGVTYESLRKELGVTRKTVERHGREGGWPALREAHVRRMSAETDRKIAELTEGRVGDESNRVDRCLRLIENYQADLAEVIDECLLRLGMVKTARTEDEAELVARFPELWDAMDAKDLNRVLLKAIDGQLDLLKQKALMTGGPTGQVEVIDKQVKELLVIDRTPEEQREFERVINRIRETAEKAGLELPEGQ